jgi:hypothetical protein
MNNVAVAILIFSSEFYDRFTFIAQGDYAFRADTDQAHVGARDLPTFVGLANGR